MKLTEKEVLRTQDIFTQIVDFDKVRSDQSQLRLRSRHPNGFDNEIIGIQLRMQNQMLRNAATGIEGQDVTVLQAGNCQVVFVARVGDHGEDSKGYRSRS